MKHQPLEGKQDKIELDTKSCFVTQRTQRTNVQPRLVELLWGRQQLTTSQTEIKHQEHAYCGPLARVNVILHVAFEETAGGLPPSEVSAAVRLKTSHHVWHPANV